MKLYLARHGDALPEELDPERSLSPLGREDVGIVAGLLSSRGVKVGKVYHSGKARARQTAEILGAAMADGAPVEKMDGLKPMDQVRPVASLVNGWTENVLLVGHLPFMGVLTSVLTAGNENAQVAEFFPGTVACLERLAPDRWIILWVVNPYIAGAD